MDLVMNVRYVREPELRPVGKYVDWLGTRAGTGRQLSCCVRSKN